MDKKLLMFQIKGEKKRSIVSLAKELNLEPVIVMRGSLEERLGAIAGSTIIPRTNRQYFGVGLPGEMLVFSGLSDTELDEFLKRFRRVGIEPIDHKAVITPVNNMWTPLRLYAELDKEINMTKKKSL